MIKMGGGKKARDKKSDRSFDSEERINEN